MVGISLVTQGFMCWEDGSPVQEVVESSRSGARWEVLKSLRVIPLERITVILIGPYFISKKEGDCRRLRLAPSCFEFSVLLCDLFFMHYQHCDTI